MLHSAQRKGSNLQRRPTTSYASLARSKKSLRKRANPIIWLEPNQPPRLMRILTQSYFLPLGAYTVPMEVIQLLSGTKLPDFPEKIVSISSAFNLFKTVKQTNNNNKKVIY
jgi:hypothetical protein